MDRALLITAFVMTALLPPFSAGAGPWVRHDLKVVIEPSGGRITVEDTIGLPDGQLSPLGATVLFALHGGLGPTSSTPGVALARDRQGRLHLDPERGPIAQPGQMPVEVYRATLPLGTTTFTLKYQGLIQHPPREQGEDYSRSFQETPGVICADGVYLTAGSYWYPRLADGLVTFALEVELPQGWDAVSQGRRTLAVREDGGRRVRWEAPEPQEGIALVAGPFTEYGRTAGPVEVMAFLRTPDEDLAARHLEAAARYLDMYAGLIGPYAYKKFALVENFWETGYGMPSFTLLGPKIIRFPFILHSSYPHEILHNWWGNSVYVDPETGNWCEGLTAYLADHLIKEQQGAGPESRQATLQKYADYCSRAKDFPLSAFTARHSPASEAVGYGKALMLFHMLRLRLGDEAFTLGLRAFYQENRFRLAGFDDLRRSFEGASGSDLEAEFAQWVARPGAPELRVARAEARCEAGAYSVSLVLEQVQTGPAFRLRVPVAVTLEGEDAAYQTELTMEERRLEVDLPVGASPLRLDVDPEFDVFRRPHRDEIPPALSGAFGAEEAVIVLPAAAAPALLEGYRGLAGFWREARAGQVEVHMDSEMEAIPKDRTVWVFGWENRFRPEVETGLAGYDVRLDDTGLTVEGIRIDRIDHSVVIASRHPGSPDRALAFLATDGPAALPGLGRKLPHYHKYSYLGFEGPDPANMAKGRWPVLDSPMTAQLAAGGKGQPAARARLAPRRALASLPPES